MLAQISTQVTVLLPHGISVSDEGCTAHWRSHYRDLLLSTHGKVGVNRNSVYLDSPRELLLVKVDIASIRATVYAITLLSTEWPWPETVGVVLVGLTGLVESKDVGCFTFTSAVNADHPTSASRCPAPGGRYISSAEDMIRQIREIVNYPNVNIGVSGQRVGHGPTCRVDEGDENSSLALSEEASIAPNQLVQGKILQSTISTHRC